MFIYFCSRLDVNEPMVGDHLLHGIRSLTSVYPVFFLFIPFSFSLSSPTDGGGVLNDMRI